jgi:hypothetical protein
VGQGVLVATYQAEDDWFHSSFQFDPVESAAELANLSLDLGERGGQSGRAGDQDDVEGYSRASTHQTIR